MIEPDFLMKDIAGRYPHIRFLFGHAGGNAAWLAQRLALLDLIANARASV